MAKSLVGEIVTKPIGRPPKLNKLEREEVLQAFKLYIERTPDPTVVGFCAFDPVGYKYLITRDNINDWDEFSTLRNYAIQKQEAYLLIAAGTGKYNPTMGIFRLKQPQHGYKDRVDTDITSDGNAIQPLLVSFINKKQDVLPDGNDTNTD